MEKNSSTWLHQFTPKSWIFLKHYSWQLFKKDALAGITVGVIALPLAMAFAIASGVPPERGLYTAIVAGFLISLLGGSRYQIGGPTGAFVVIIYDVVERVGYDGLVLATILAGMILLVAAFSQFGSLIKYIPYPLVIGFTTGIAVIIFSSQIKDFFGLATPKLPADFIPKWKTLIQAFPTFQFSTLILSGATLLLIILIRRFFPKIPWALGGVIFALLISWIFKLPVETIQSRFGGIQPTLPSFTSPQWSTLFTDVHLLIPDAITIAFLAGIESLLSALVADGMGRTRHKSNCELMGQGVANIASVLFGGIPATGAIARTAANIKNGAQTPFSGMIHALTVLILMLLLSPLVSQIPLAALAAVLMMVAWNMSELHHFRHLFKAPRGDVAILLTSFLLTVFVDLTVAIEAGMILALFLFMKRMSEKTGLISLKTIEKEYTETDETFDLKTMPELPQGIELYEMTGPFFFGVVDHLKSILTNLESPPKIFILRLRKVPFIDASGLHALLDFYEQCKTEKTTLLLSGVHKTLYQKLKKFQVLSLIGEEHIFTNTEQALQFAKNQIR